MFITPQQLTDIMQKEDRYVNDLWERWGRPRLDKDMEACLRMGKRAELLGDLEHSMRMQGPVCLDGEPLTGDYLASAYDFAYDQAEDAWVSPAMRNVDGQYYQLVWSPDTKHCHVAHAVYPLATRGDMWRLLGLLRAPGTRNLQWCNIAVPVDDVDDVDGQDGPTAADLAYARMPSWEVDNMDTATLHKTLARVGHRLAMLDNDMDPADTRQGEYLVELRRTHAQLQKALLRRQHAGRQVEAGHTSK